ncbi:unnamed protein product [Gongylonema pulchrum]|uniref:Uncharacterized protein n=1 Tax=Gongylonema pulchrum TaxID=637853 RepID=A0A3P6SLS3_9BILA|nr:unnamed protein product [Gongylonema pulchrum]
MLLQNENTAIREKAAELCSHWVNLKVAALNPQIVLWWFVDRSPELKDIMQKHGSFDSNEHNQLFDPCASNPYAEAVPLGIKYLKGIERLVA